MTFRELIADIQASPQGNSITLDSRLSENDWVAYLINEARAKEIGDTFQRNGDIHSTWIQPFVPKAIIKVGKDETELYDHDKDYGKIELPRLVQFKQRNSNHLNMAVRNVNEVKTGVRFFPTSHERMMLYKTSNSEASKKNHYWMIGDSMYLSKVASRVSMNVILADPLKGHIFDNGQKETGELIIGTTYKVKNGSISHNSIVVNAPDTFVAVNEDFTGSGIVYPTLFVRKRTIDDEYPISESMIEIVKMKIWGKDFKMAIESPKDKIGNANEEALNKA